MSLDSVIAGIISGVATGIGSTIGSFIAIKYFIDNMDKVPSVKERIKAIIDREKNKGVEEEKD